ncbi:unnamed protein product [marine sediment metagenome]|uniref:Uncharacterized protein n=1 Tax=marine sediment metagenome TaxID=412755 RepID=X1N844_9ZZZZ
MTTFSQKVERKILVKTAAKEIKKEIEQAGLDKLKELADLNISIIETYLRSRSPQQKARYRRNSNSFLLIVPSNTSARATLVCASSSTYK